MFQDQQHCDWQYLSVPRPADTVICSIGDVPSRDVPRPAYLRICRRCHSWSLWGHPRSQKKSIKSSPCLQERKIVRNMLFANGGGCAPPNPPAALEPFLLAIKKHHVITVFKVRETRADHDVCKWGELRPPTPRCLKVIRACNKAAASCHHHVCRKGKLCGSFCLQVGAGLHPPPSPQTSPPPPAVLMPSTIAIKRKHHVVTMFAVRESCAGHFVSKWGGVAPPPIPPLFCRPPMYAITKKYHARTWFAVREGCATALVRA